MPTIEKFDVRDVGERSWGREILLSQTPHYISKLLLMRAGTAGGLQAHRVKDETFYLHSGKALVTTDFGDGVLTELEMHEGESYHIPPGAVHRVHALTDCVFFEASTPHFDDRVRLEGKYNLPDSGGLPTTGHGA
jgi:mannose-6-phosphate isomerase-like protein (cupin superfamily)